MPLRYRFTRLSLAEQPLLFASIALMCGLIAATRVQAPLRSWGLGAATLWIVSTICLLSRPGSWLGAVVLLLGCFVTGGALWKIDQQSVAESRIRRLFERGELKIDEPIELIGTLNAAPELAPDRIYLSVIVEQAVTLGREHRASGAVNIVAPFNDEQSRRDYDALRLDYGARLRLLCHLSNRHGYRNPGAPDFDELLGYRGYDATGWVKSPLLIERLGKSAGNPIRSWLYRLRARALKVILRHFSQPASGILAAALFGNQHFLSRETAEVFRAGGTFHLLVISGLHVALIAAIALWLARRLSRRRIVQYFFVIGLIWAYALMVGGQPAITRSAVMLTMALIGQSIIRASHGANALGATAIALLVWQPPDLFNPAFQLSFLTVLMIVVLTGPLYSRLKQIGEWQPTVATPYPPRAPLPVKKLSEMLFWDEVAFRREMKDAYIRYRLIKTPAARRLNLWRLQKATAWVAVTVFTTTGVQVGLLPLMTAYFHRVSLISPITNVIEAALVFALMIVGALYLLIYPIAGGMAMKLSGVVNLLGSLTVKASEPLLRWKKASARVPDFGDSATLIFIAYFAAALILIILIDRWNPLRKGGELIRPARKTIARACSLTALSTTAILAWLLIAHPFAHRFERGRLCVTFLDVGQGDAILIVFPHGGLMMMDAGGRPNFNARGKDEDGFVEDRIGIAEASVMPYLWRRGIARLDWIAASHGDADHVEGFAELVRSFEIGAAIKGQASRSDLPPSIFDQAVQSANLQLQTLKRGDLFEIDGVQIHVLSPFADRAENSTNNDSLVLKLTFGSRSFLLTGDIEKETEARLVEAETDLRVDVLKVAHHGSKTSSTAEFLAKVNPQHAVISVADPSPFGHPHPEVVARLRGAGAEVWQTSRCGAITISTDGKDLRVETFVKCGKN